MKDGTSSTTVFASPVAHHEADPPRKMSGVAPSQIGAVQPPFDIESQFISPTREPGSLVLGHFDVLEILGRGGYGIVVKAFDRKLRRTVAIKMMTTEMAATSPARKRFVREARAAAAVSHENIVQIYNVEEQPTPYLVMEYIPGTTLQQHIDDHGPLEVIDVLRIGAQIARGLSAAHEMGLIHRDIKPANILLEQHKNLRVKITDFGLAQTADDASLTQSGTVVGTPMYMAPEQASGDELDFRSDLYSLGSVLYVMLSGRPPFRASNSFAVLKRVATDTPRPIREIIPEVPQWLCDIIARLHAKRPQDRFRSAAELAELLEACLANLQRGIHKPIAPIAKRATSRSWQRRLALAAGFLASVAIGLSVAITTHTPQASGATDTPESPPAAVVESMPPTFTNSIGMKFTKVNRGKSQLGGHDGNTGTEAVDIDYDFYIGVYEVTCEEWTNVLWPGRDSKAFWRMGLNSSDVATFPDSKVRRFPVNTVSWYEAEEFVAKLNRQVQEPGWVYRLPLSVEWEYACRGGPGQTAEDLSHDYYFAVPTSKLLADQANFRQSGLQRPSEVGSYPPNRLGIYDMHGNVFELCEDGIEEGKESLRLLRGGFWDDEADCCGAARRNMCHPQGKYRGAGLRLVRVRQTTK